MRVPLRGRRQVCEPSVCGLQCVPTARLACMFVVRRTDQHPFLACDVRALLRASAEGRLPAQRVQARDAIGVAPLPLRAAASSTAVLCSVLKVNYPKGIFGIGSC